jgi:hypothetical protein
MAIVPVMPLGTGLTVGDAPNCKPFAPTGAPGTIPSDEVAPSEGVTVPTWANAGPQHNKGNAATMMKNGLMDDLPDKSGTVKQRGAARTEVGKAAEAMIFFITADR